MKALSLNKESYQQWNNFIDASDEAWFWHSLEWMHYTIEHSAGKFIENKSFFIEENRQVLAVCPVFVEKMSFKGGKYKQFAYSGEPMPALAILNNVREEKRQKIIKLYLEKIKDIALEKKIDFISIRMTPLALAFLNKEMPLANPFVRYGYIDLPYQTQMIDLRNNLEILWNDIRKGHKSDIKKASDTVKINIWNSGNITRDIFKQYQMLHRKDAGRVTRSQKTFDLMYDWIKAGKAALIEAVLENNSVGFALIIIYKSGAYYGSACSDPDIKGLAAAHLIQWEAIKYLKENGVLFYDIGLQYYGLQWFYSLSQKEVNISKFKRGFGGKAVPLITGEYYFSQELMKGKFRERMDNNFNLYSEKSASESLVS